MDLKTPPSQNSHTTRTRDAALRRLGRANRWLIAGSAALAGAFTAVAANAFPGRTANPVTASNVHTGDETGGNKSRTSRALKPPPQAPQSSETPTTSTPAAQESTPTHQSTPAQESTPAEESASARESTPAQEAAPAQKSAPAPETSAAPPQESAPVTSGGS